MTTLAIFTLEMTEPETFQAYAKHGGEALARHGGTALQASKELTALEGEFTLPDLAVVLSFPDREAALAWHKDPDLAEVHALRQKAGKGMLILL